MKTCQQCTRMEFGICAHYTKAPPPGFAERCRNYDRDQTFVEPVKQERSCEQCNRYDRDDTGEWCLYYMDDEVARFVILSRVWICPLEGLMDIEMRKTRCTKCDKDIYPALGEGSGPHAAKLSCPLCGKHLRWVSKKELASHTFSNER